MMESKSAGGPAIETQKSALRAFIAPQKQLTWWCLGPFRCLEHVLDDQLTQSGEDLGRRKTCCEAIYNAKSRLCSK